MGDIALIFSFVGIGLIVIIVVALIVASIIDAKRKKLIREILKELHLERIEDDIFKQNGYDERVVVKSKQALFNYTDIKFFKDNDSFERVRMVMETRKLISSRLYYFLQNNSYENRALFKSVKKRFNSYLQRIYYYIVLVAYITPAGNNRGEILVKIGIDRVEELVAHPESLMTKGEFNKLLKQQEKNVLDAKKHSLYDRVNSIIDFANSSKETLIVKSQVKTLDELVQKLFDKTVNRIQKVSKTDSDEWWMLEGFINSIEKQVQEIVRDDKRISDYYDSEAFSKIKETCSLLTQSQREFNEYINEKAQSIIHLFGTRVVRNETQNEDVYNYIRAYKKSITPFTAEVSAAVFGSAENNPISYIIKYFYPYKSQYPEQIEKLRLLIEELETLKEAKEIIDKYKKEYDQYIQNVPDYVLKNDEAGFYSRLGLAIIDESVLNVEYKFVYTSDGGMAQRSFTVPMNEENITELIEQLESKLSMEALTKEQRALMTTKLRNYIKERDNYTCCQCGNSISVEPNLLLEIDHIIPVSKGGLTKEDNLQTLCWKCNRNKGAKIVLQ